ncbi:prephenate dehydrogenase/arogenate dehydrogenase family protein [bacterium]|nr:prephenate dehydrogenase/arogenate dehydrogenase family protein [bacterium]MBU1153640.1 prephenate dehydrogenase/arogenate dehydrogenase family protein [bacterium]MBU1782413.1 prephenate dehydrogenase/arogenate dehydrogenase family protein [bacterium]
MIKQLTIIGLGLIGGSLGLALKAKNKNLKIIGVARNSNQIEKAVRLGVIDQGFIDPKKGVEDSDVVVIATPIRAIEKVVLEIIPFVKPSCVITDTGSTKNEITSSDSLFFCQNINFVGSHPIAGSHLFGIEAAKKDLFAHKPCIITPLPSTSEESLKQIKEIWELAGAKIYFLTPLEHDEIFALISHLPHILASALINITNDLQKKFPILPDIIAPSFRDMTRIAASNSYMWSDIVLSNDEMILKSITLLKDKISYWEKIIKEKENIQIKEEFSNSKKWKEENNALDNS